VKGITMREITYLSDVLGAVQMNSSTVMHGKVNVVEDTSGTYKFIFYIFVAPLQTEHDLGKLFELATEVFAGVAFKKVLYGKVECLQAEIIESSRLYEGVSVKKTYIVMLPDVEYIASNEAALPSSI
jgi:hypothetical protein